MTEEERAELLEDEWLIVRHSGEIPEITYHSSLYYLSVDPDGPGLDLRDAEKNHLKDAALQRYHEIVLRDIQLENFHKTIYRGVKRTIYNWHRYMAFKARQNIDSNALCEPAAQMLILFLEQGAKAAGKSLPQNFLNCYFDELLAFAKELNIQHEKLSPKLAQFCLPGCHKQQKSRKEIACLT